jgi:hypothetical protein
MLVNSDQSIIHLNIPQNLEHLFPSMTHRHCYVLGQLDQKDHKL